MNLNETMARCDVSWHSTDPDNWKLGDEGKPFLCQHCEKEMPEKAMFQGKLWGKLSHERDNVAFETFFKYCSRACFISSEVGIAMAVETEYVEQCEFTEEEASAYRNDSKRLNLWKQDVGFCRGYQGRFLVDSREALEGAHSGRKPSGPVGLSESDAKGLSGFDLQCW